MDRLWFLQVLISLNLQTKNNKNNYTIGSLLDLNVVI